MSDARHVLVTGANSGIGLATVLHLAGRGFRATGSVRSDAKADVVGADAEVVAAASQLAPTPVEDRTLPIAQGL